VPAFDSLIKIILKSPIPVPGTTLLKSHCSLNHDADTMTRTLSEISEGNRTGTTHRRKQTPAFCRHFPFQRTQQFGVPFTAACSRNYSWMHVRTGPKTRRSPHEELSTRLMTLAGGQGRQTPFSDNRKIASRLTASQHDVPYGAQPMAFVFI
jgi:hypothetical protein